MKTKMITFLLTNAFAASLLFAQGPGPATGTPPDPAKAVQRRVERLTKLLGLTSLQQTDATAIFTKAATDSSAALTGLRTARQSLHTAVQNNDLSGINQASTTIGNLTAQLTSAAALAEAAFYRILTPDQQNKLNSFEGEGRGRFGPGPGGPGFDGPGPGGPGPGGNHRGRQ